MTSGGAAFASFREPRTGSREEEEEEQWQDEKLGFGGMRDPVVQGQAPRHESVYPNVEKNPFGDP